MKNNRLHAHLKEYTNRELYQILENVENMPSSDLIYYCSEILRRIWDPNETNSGEDE